MGGAAASPLPPRLRAVITQWASSPKSSRQRGPVNLGPLTHLGVCQPRDPPPGRALSSRSPLLAGPGQEAAGPTLGRLEAVGVALLAELAEENPAVFIRESAERLQSPPIGQAIFTT